MMNPFKKFKEYRQEKAISKIVQSVNFGGEEEQLKFVLNNLLKTTNSNL